MHFRNLKFKCRLAGFQPFQQATILTYLSTTMLYEKKKNPNLTRNHGHMKRLYFSASVNSGSLSNYWRRCIISHKVTQAALLSLEDQRDGSNHAVCSVPRIWWLLSLGPTTSYPSSLNWCRMTLSSEQVHLFLQRWRTLAGKFWAALSGKRK